MHYPELTRFGWPSWCYWLWRKFACRRECHLFSEVYGTGGNKEFEKHYLVCDACQLMVFIHSIDDRYTKPEAPEEGRACDALPGRSSIPARNPATISQARLPPSF